MRCWKGTLVSGTWTSGMRGVKGFTKSRKRTARENCQQLLVGEPGDVAIDVAVAQIRGVCSKGCTYGHSWLRDGRAARRSSFTPVGR